jgi:AcrR family transcriptional regulator
MCMVSQVSDRPATRPRNRRGQGARLRSELIEAARQLLMTAAQESDVSIRAVTRAAGAAPQSFYLQFATLDDLLQEVYALEFSLLGEAIAAAVDRAPDPVAALRALGRAYCDYAQQYPGRYQAMTGLRGRAHDAWDPAQFPGMPIFTAAVGTVAAALAAVGRGDADPRAEAASLWAWLHGVIVLRADRPAFPWPPMDDMLDTLVAHFLAPPYPLAPPDPRSRDQPDGLQAAVDPEPAEREDDHAPEEPAQAGRPHHPGGHLGAVLGAVHEPVGGYQPGAEHSADERQH